MFSFIVKTYGTWRSGYPGQKQGKNTAYLKITLVATLTIGVIANNCVKNYFSHNELFPSLQNSD